MFIAKAHQGKTLLQQDECPTESDVQMTIIITLFISVLNIVYPVLYATVFVVYSIFHRSTHNLDPTLLLYLKERFLRGRIPFVWLFYDEQLMMPGSYVAVLSVTDITRLVVKVITMIVLAVSLSSQPLFTLISNCITISLLGWVLWVGEVLSIFFLALPYLQQLYSQ